MMIGTCVKVTVTFSAAPDSAVISIIDPGGTTKVDAVAMTEETTTVYSYVYQSNMSDDDGTYVARIAATSGSYTPRAEGAFILDPVITS